VETTAGLIRKLQLTCMHRHVAARGAFQRDDYIETPGECRLDLDPGGKDGNPADTILQTAELEADLIVITTDGPEGVLDGLRGTTSELVLRKARRPVANLPAGSILG
jgi:hypothetical protein